MPARILVVDDENTTTSALDLLLRDGYDVNTASSAAEAETLLARRWFDLVFLDLRLPDADGIGLLEHIKRTAPAPPAPTSLHSIPRQRSSPRTASGSKPTDRFQRLKYFCASGHIRVGLRTVTKAAAGEMKPRKKLDCAR